MNWNVWLDLERLECLDRFECLDRLQCLDRLEFLATQECLDGLDIETILVVLKSYGGGSF